MPVSERAPWTGGRAPLTDPAEESARTGSYWQWLNAKGTAEGWTASGGEPHGLVALGCAEDADFEAWHMRHSIGHSWAKYSGFGDIFSLRSEAGIPLATVLVSKGAVVHAREHENARLSLENQARLEAEAATRGWTVKRDETPFDVLPDEGAPNTRFKYLHRDPYDGTKSFETVVFAGRLDRQQIAILMDGLQGGLYFRPAVVGLPALGGNPRFPCEVLAVRFVHDAPTHGSADAFCQAWAEASDARWPMPEPALRR